MSAHTAVPPIRTGAMVALLAMVGFFLAMDVSLTLLLIEPMKRELGLSDLQIGLLQGSAYGLALGFTALPLGRLVDRLSRVVLIRFGLGISVVAMSAMAFVHSVAALMIARMALGMTSATLVPAAFSMMADVCEPDRRTVSASMLVVGQAAGQAVGILAGGLAFDALTRFLASHPGGLFGLSAWRLLYLACACVGLTLLVMLTALREPARREVDVADAPLAVALREIWERRRFVVPLLFALMFSQMTAQAASIWSPPMMVRNFGLTPGELGLWLSAAMMGGGIVGSFGAGRLGMLGIYRFGRPGVLVPAIVATLFIAPLSLYGMASALPLFATMLGLHILAGAIAATLGATAITLLMPNEVRGLTFGLNAFVSAVFGAALAPPLIAWLSGHLGGGTHIGTAMAVLCIPSAIASALLLVGATRAARSAPDPLAA